MSFSDFFKSKKTEPRAQKGDAPSHWIKCPNCNALMYYKEVFSQSKSVPNAIITLESLHKRGSSYCAMPGVSKNTTKICALLIH